VDLPRVKYNKLFNRVGWLKVSGSGFAFASTERWVSVRVEVISIFETQASKGRLPALPDRQASLHHCFPAGVHIDVFGDRFVPVRFPSQVLGMMILGWRHLNCHRKYSQRQFIFYY
jgi:hypothetical protein